MKEKIRKFFKITGFLILGLVLVLFFLSFRDIPQKITYGVSFSKYRSQELNLDYKEVLRALLDDLNVKKFRLAAHWTMIEPENGTYDFSDLDYQMSEIQRRNGRVVLSVGRRLPSWPECHEPEWAKKLVWDERKKEITDYITQVVNRYKSYEAIEYWQVENEPFLTVFAYEHCGDLDKQFLKEEVALVKQLDPNHPILVTDSGNLGLWHGAWRAGDAFGTSVYMYLWNPTIGQVRSVYLPSFYRVKTSLMELLFGKKESFLIELSLEPWLLEPIANASFDIQKERMSLTKFDEVISFARKTGFDTQYLWGAEWWYWMKDRNYPDYWEKARSLFKNE